jgi:competence protein ComEC
MLLAAGALLWWKYRIVQWMIWGMCGFGWALLRADLMLSNSLDPALEGVPVMLEGTITGLPVRRDNSTRFVLEIEQLLDDKAQDRPHPGRARISWYNNAPELIPGQRWRLAVKLKRPWGFSNPGGFDYEGWLFRQGVRATGYVLDKGNSQLLGEAAGEPLNRMRWQLREQLSGMIEGDITRALVPALAVGDRSLMDNEQWRVLNATGTNHLLAISGLHIGFIAGMVFFAVRRSWPGHCKFARSIASPRIAAVAAILAAAGYAAMAGFAIPTQRALVMTGAVLLQTCLYLRTSRSHLFCLALLVVLLLDPFAVLSTGFWLSFCAVAIIITGMTGRVQAAGIWWKWGRSQYLVAVGLAPLLVLWFQQIPLLSIAANIVAVPWVSLVSVPLILSGSIMMMINGLAANLLLGLAASSLHYLWLLLDMLASWQITILSLPAPGWLAMATAIPGVVLLLVPHGIPRRWLGLILLLPLFYPDPDLPESGAFRLVLLDVGQGLAAVIVTHAHIVLYDTGPGYSPVSNAAGSVIIPWLRHQGVNRVDVLVQSHGDHDHMGGLADLLKAVPVRSIITSVPEKIQPGAGAIMCSRGQSWLFDGIKFEILHPEPATRYRGNNASCVLKVSNATHAVLLPGDIERSAEAMLVLNNPHAIAADVLIAPHHGSKTSSTPAFVSATAADYVLFSAGYRNRFGFPNKDIIKRYRSNQSTILDTVRSGAIEMNFNSAGVRLVSHRQQSQRFWHSLYQVNYD